MGNVALNLPTPGQDSGTWGDKINAALNAIHGDYLNQTDGLTAATAAATYETQTDAASHIAYLAGLDTTGATDIGAQLQDAFDTRRHVILPAGTLKLATAVFLDDTTDLQAPYVLESMGGSVLQLAAGLPTSSAFSDATTGWALFINTLRSGLTGSTVTVSDATRAGGANYPAAPRLVIRNMVIDGGGLNLGAVYGNTAAVRFENCMFRNLKYGGSWYGYADGWTIDGGQVVSQPVGGWVLKQENNGDCIQIRGLKGLAGHWNAANCFGGQIVGSVGGGYRFAGCRGIEIVGPHVELDEPGAFGSFLWLDRSTVNVRGGFVQASKSGGYSIEVADSAADPDGATRLLLDGLTFCYAYKTGDSDLARSPDVRITSINGGGRVRKRNCQSVSSQSGVFPKNPGSGPYITSAVTAVTTALTAAGHLVGTSDWELAFNNGVWEVLPPAGGTFPGRRYGAPALLSTPALAAPGTLTAAASMQYQCAMRDSQGLFSAASGTITAVVPSGGAVGLEVNTQVLGMCRVYRSSSATVTTAPDVYCDVPLDVIKGVLCDTGANLQGFPWQTAGASHTPALEAGSNHTFERLVNLVTGCVDGWGSGSPEGVVTAPVGSTWRRSDGAAGTSFYVKESGTGNTGWVAK